jgi:hypothetical protein
MVLSTQEQHETSDSPEYKIDARWPKLEWGNDPRTAGFNQAVETYTQQTLQTFKEDVANLDPSIPSETSSYIDIDYEVNNATADLLSVEMKITIYEAGAMHPGHTLYGINYDLQEGKFLNLADLFQPDAQYLETISSFCIDSLSSRNILSWEEGALPKAENYQVWNLAPEGMIIFFNEYQIAPYAAGPQSVLIPYEHLSSILRSGGPLDGLLKK